MFDIDIRTKKSLKDPSIALVNVDIDIRTKKSLKNPRETILKNDLYPLLLVLLFKIVWPLKIFQVLIGYPFALIVIDFLIPVCMCHLVIGFTFLFYHKLVVLIYHFINWPFYSITFPLSLKSTLSLRLKFR